MTGLPPGRPSAAALPRVAILEDCPELGEECRRRLRGGGYSWTDLTSASELFELLEGAPIDLLVTGLRLPDAAGLEVIREVLRRSPRTSVLVLTAHGSIESAVEATQLGAVNYLTRLSDLEELRQIVLDVAGARAAGGPGTREPIGSPSNRAQRRIVGGSREMDRVRGLVLVASRSCCPVLIHGPSGTGKDLVANAIHDASSRRDGPFIPVNCGALPEGLLEAELFGAVKGAFTGAVAARQGLFEAARGGTLFLDELGAMSPSGQVKLLRVLQDRRIRPVGSTEERAVDVRVIAATNREPAEHLAEGKLREDLYYRLAVLAIRIPPLAEHLEDLPELCEHILREMPDRWSAEGDRVSAEALRELQDRDWPGNVRELENVLRRIRALHGECGEILLEHLPEPLTREDVCISERRPPAKVGGGGIETIQDAEASLVRRALARTRGNKAQAARALGISRPNLYFKLKRYGIEG